LQGSSVLLQYSNTLTTLRTPPVVRARSVAVSASVSVTRPSRKTTPASVTTFTCNGFRSLTLTKRPFTLAVMAVSLALEVPEERPAT